MLLIMIFAAPHRRPEARERAVHTVERVAVTLSIAGVNDKTDGGRRAVVDALNQRDRYRMPVSAHAWS